MGSNSSLGSNTTIFSSSFSSSTFVLYPSCSMSVVHTSSPPLFSESFASSYSFKSPTSRSLHACVCSSASFTICFACSTNRCASACFFTFFSVTVAGASFSNTSLLSSTTTSTTSFSSFIL